MVNKEEFKAYEEVRQSGMTNMFVIDTVGTLSGLTKEVIMAIMSDYKELKEKFGDKNV